MQMAAAAKCAQRELTAVVKLVQSCRVSLTCRPAHILACRARTQHPGTVEHYMPGRRIIISEEHLRVYETSRARP